MKTKLYTTVLSCVGSALVASVGFAQDTPSTQSGGTSTEPGYGTGRHSMMHGQPIRASKITGAQVKSAAGETLGTIEDVLINPRSGHAEFALLSLTGPTGTTPTGAGEKLTAIPWKLLSLSSPPQPGGLGSQQYSFTASVDQSKLASAPNFEKNQWPDMSRGDWSHKVSSYYGVTQDSGSGGTGSGLERGTGPSTDKGAGASGLQPKSDTQ